MSKRLALMLFLVLIPSFAFLTGWELRQNATLDFQFIHGEYISQIPVDTQTLITQGKLQSNCEDLRFTTTDDTLLNIWADISCNSSATPLSVRINQPISTGNKTIIMYYGNSGATSVFNFNLTYSNDEIPNGNFEDDTVGGNPATYTITDGGSNGIVDVNDTLSYDLNKSVFILDNGGGGGQLPDMLRTFTSTSNTSIYEYMINIGSLSGDHIINSIGDSLSTGNVQTWAFKQNTSISVWSANIETFTNCTWVSNEWLKFQISIDFSTDKNKVWLNNSFCGEFDFRENVGESSQMQTTTFTFSSAGTGFYNIDAIRLRPYDNPEPSVFFGAEESDDLLSLITNSTNPNIFETVKFDLVSGSTFNFTKFWWNFNDSSTDFTLVPTVNHFFTSVGPFNISVIALNESGTNFTSYVNLTTFETVVEIWAQDTSTNNFLENFTINITNSTDSDEFTVNGFFGLWNMTDHPFGNVTLQLILSGYNHTQTNFQTIGSDINRTELLNPAVITLFTVSHQKFFDVVVPIPANIIFSNSTTLKSFGPVEEEFANIDCNVCGNDAITSDIGMFFRYKTSDLGGPGSGSRLFICPTLTGSCEEIRNLDGVSEEGYLIIKDDGSWETRTTANVLTSSGNIVGTLPARIKLTVGAGPSEHVQINITQMKSPYAECFINSGCPTGNVTIQVSKVSTGIYSSVDNYKNTYINLQDITSTVSKNITAYFMTPTLGYAVKFITFDSSNQGLLGAYVKVWKQDDVGNLFVISSMFTDGTGSTPFTYFEKDSTIFVLATFADLDSGGIKPIFVGESNLEVNLLLGVLSIVIDDPSFKGVTITANPFIDTIKEGTNQQFNVTIVDSLSNLINTTWNLSDTKGTFSFSETSTSSTGAIFNQNVSVPELNGTINMITMSYGIWRTFDGSPVFTSSSLRYFVYPSLNLGNICDLSTSLSGFKGLISLILIGGAFVIHPLFGGILLIPLGFWCLIGWDVVTMGLLFSVAFYLGVRR